MRSRVDSASSIGKSCCSPPASSPSSFSPSVRMAWRIRAPVGLDENAPRTFVRSIVARVQPASSARRCIPMVSMASLTVISQSCPYRAFNNFNSSSLWSSAKAKSFRKLWIRCKLNA